MDTKHFASSVLAEAITYCRAQKVSVYTFSLYFDHESPALSVCVDTESNSRVKVADINAYNAKHFQRAIDEGDLSDAALWLANIGRNLSLGDFAFVNIARTNLSDFAASEDFFLQLVRAMIDEQHQILLLSPDPSRLIFTCSGPVDEVEYVWGPLPTSQR